MSPIQTVDHYRLQFVLVVHTTQKDVLKLELSG